jgi:hypothetical protein
MTDSPMARLRRHFGGAGAGAERAGAVSAAEVAAIADADGDGRIRRVAAWPHRRPPRQQPNGLAA